MGPVTCNCLRFLLGATFLFLLVILKRSLFEKGDGGGVLPRISKAEWKGGVACGLFLFAASLVQQIGLTESDVGTTAFITALYIVIVPALGVFFRRRVRLGVWISVLLALGGAYLLTVVGASPSADGISSIRDLFGAIGTAKLILRLGDLLVFACAILYSFHILTVDRYADRCDGLILSMIQFAVAGVLGILPMLLFESVSLSGVIAGLPGLLYLGILSCGIAFTLQVLGQARVEPTIASMLMSLESVFGAIGGALVLHEIMNVAEIVGCAIVFGAIILSQLVCRERK
jgi:drug/metabolite transporter (DMT)-like permease